MSINPGEKVYAQLCPDLCLGAKSMSLTMSGGVGSVPLPDSCRLVGLKPASTTMRVGLEPVEANGAGSGASSWINMRTGVPVDSDQTTWFNIGQGFGRTLYFRGGASDVIEVIVM